MYFVEYGNAMLNKLLLLYLLSIILVSCTVFNDSGSIFSGTNVVAKEDSDMIFDQTINSATNDAKKMASSAS